MLCMHNTTILFQFGLFVTSLPTHISINSHPFPVGIVSVVWLLCVIVRLARLQERSRTCHDSNMGSLGAKWACMQFKYGSHVFRSHVRSSCMLHQLSATRSLILNVSTCKEVCRRHDDPTNGPTGDPSMVRLP